MGNDVHRDTISLKVRFSIFMLRHIGLMPVGPRSAHVCAYVRSLDERERGRVCLSVARRCCVGVLLTPLQHLSVGIELFFVLLRINKSTLITMCPNR